MRLPIGDTVIEWDLLLQVVWAALVAGVVVTIAVSLAIVGAGRAADARRDGDRLDAIIFSAVFLVGLLVCIGAAVLGIVVMTAKG
jgi:hypothetical protein